MESKHFSKLLDEQLIDLVKNHPILYQFNHKNFKDSAEKENAWLKISLLLNKNVTECKTRWRTIRDSYRKNKNKIKTGSKPNSKSKYNNENLKFLDNTLWERGLIAGFEDAHTFNYDDIHADKNQSFELVETIKVEIEDLNAEDREDGLATELLEETSSSKRSLDTTESNSCPESTPQKKSRTKRLNIKTIDEMNETPQPENGVLNDFISSKQLPSDPSEHPIETFFRSMGRTVMHFPAHLVAETRIRVCQIVSEMELRAISEQTSPTPAGTSSSNTWVSTSPFEHCKTELLSDEDSDT